MNAPSLAADHLFRLMVEQNTMGITLTDRNGIIIYANPRQLDASGYTLDEVVGQNPRIFSAGETPREVYETLWTTILAGRIWYGELTNRRKNGEICRELLRIAPIRNDAGEISHFFAVKEENPFGNIQHLLSGTVATVDPLTGLSNRAMLVDKLDRLLQVTPETNAKPFAVLAVDIDQFRAINESIGQQAADELLMCLAVRLQQCVRQSDVVARIGSNQFVLLIPGEENETQLEDLVRRLLLSIATPAMIQGRKIIATASIGVARSPLDGKHTDLLLQCADSALTAAKNAGGDDFCFYAPPVEQVAKDWSNLREALRDVTERNELVLHYQPKVDLRSGQVIGLEALLRWQHPEHGLLAPSRFIPIAEETGLIVKLSQWVISNVLHQLRDWQQAGRPPITVGVNLSLRHFRANDLPGFIAAELAATGVDPSLLELEISENTIMQDPTQSFILVDRLKSLGIRLALDDFGTRLSSLSYLSRMNVAQWPLQQGMKFMVAGELGYAPNTPLRRVTKTGTTGHGDGVAAQISFNLIDFFPHHSVGLVFGQAGDGWLLSPDFGDNARLAEVRYQWVIDKKQSFEARVRQREDIRQRIGSLDKREDFDYYLRYTYKF